MTAGAIALRTLIVGGIIVFAVITGFAYTTLYERKILARLQGRIGPNRAGYIPVPRRGRSELRLLGGVLQPAADAVKLFMKEDITPNYVDWRIYTLAPMLTVLPAVMSLAVIPWAGRLNAAGEPVSISLFGFEDIPYLAIAPGLNVAVLLLLAITSIEVYGIVLAGWSSNSKYAVLGGIRSTAQMVSYELSLGLSLLIPVMIAGSLNLNEIVNAQVGGWFVFLQPLAAIIFFIGVLAELQRAPFDLLEAEQELSSGYNVEYAGMRFAMFFMAEYMNMIIFSAIWVTLFWGGYRFLGLTDIVISLPSLGIEELSLYMLGVPIFIVKIMLSLFLMIWIRASLPRLRYDQLMSFGWKFMLPVSVLNVMATGIFIVLNEEGVFDGLYNYFGSLFG